MISVIVPTIHQVELVQQCINSYRSTTFDLASEIIIVDDGSPPSIQQSLREWTAAEHIHYIPKPNNEGFSKAVNAGIIASSSEYVLLVNNDIVFQQADWLNPMVHLMNTSQDIGIVGARLLYPDQTIQHGGVFPTRRGYFDHRYRFLPADHPPALLIEDVHAVTGALMLIRRSLLQQIGMLSERYFIAFEDIDLCYRAKRHGYRVVYCGTSYAIHLEGQTRGTSKHNKNPYWYSKEREARALFWSVWRGERF